MTSRSLGIRRGLAATTMLCAFAGVAYANDTAALADRLHRAAANDSLDDASLKPWHLKLSFQLFDAKGVATEQGTIEEWWASPTLHKTVYTSPSYTSTEIQTKGGLYRSKGASSAPYLLELVLRQVVHPMPEESDITSGTPDMRKETIGKVPLDCIMLSQKIKRVADTPLGLFPTYCFDHDADRLQLSYEFGSQMTVLNRHGKFQEHYVALDQKTVVNDVTAVTGRIDTLQGVTMPEPDFVPSADFEKIGADRVKVAGGVINGLALSKPSPIYPQRARENHVSGSVLIAVTIGRDGRIHSMRLLSVPDPDLALAALAAVRQWVYKPYLLNGVPTEVETTVTVNFNFGPR